MIFIEKNARIAHARQVRGLVASGITRKKAFLQVSLQLRSEGFKCVPRTIYRWLKEARIALPKKSLSQVRR